jgi:hypothetical protein
VLRPGPCAWIAAEGVRSLRTRRLPALLGKYGDANVRVLPRTIELLTNVDALVRELQGTALIVIDSLRRVAGRAEENSNTEMGLVVAAGERLALETGAAVLFIAHASLKSNDPTATRGATAVDDAVEQAFNIESDASLPGLFHVRQGFARDRGAWEGASFKLVPSARSCVVEWIGGAAPMANSKAGSRNSAEQTEAVEVVRKNGGKMQRLVLIAALRNARLDRKVANIERSISRAIDGGRLKITPDDEVHLP